MEAFGLLFSSCYGLRITFDLARIKSFKLRGLRAGTLPSGASPCYKRNSNQTAYSLPRITISVSIDGLFAPFKILLYASCAATSILLHKVKQDHRRFCLFMNGCKSNMHASTVHQRSSQERIHQHMNRKKYYSTSYLAFLFKKL